VLSAVVCLEKKIVVGVSAQVTVEFEVENVGDEFYITV